MIFIAVKWRVRPDLADRWTELPEVRDFTEATRAEPGNIFYDWSRSVEDPTEYVLLEAFQDGAAEAHVTAEHFTVAMSTLGAMVVERPKIINFQVEGTEWSRLGELQMDD